MAPLPCASVSDLYGSNFGLSAEQIAQQTLKNNQQCAEDNSKYQQGLKENQIAGKANFQENFPQSTFGNLNGNNTNIPPMTNQANNNNLRNVNFGPNPAPISENHSQFARRPAWSDVHNNWPSNQGISMFNRFQDIFGTRENFGASAGTDSDCLRQLVNIAHNIELVLKIIMFVIILLFIIKLLEKRNS